MSGSTGAPRIKSREDFVQFVKSYTSLISKFPGFVSVHPSGSFNSNLVKTDFGDIDLITLIESAHSKSVVKEQLVNFFSTLPDNVVVPFTSDKHAGRKTYNAGELVTIRYYDNVLGYSAQIDNIVALDKEEAVFKQQFLDMPASVQGLVLGLVKVSTIETPLHTLFKKVNITEPTQLPTNQEYEFNLSSVELQLRKVTYEPESFKQKSRTIVYTSRDFDVLQKLLYQYKLNSSFDNLLQQSKRLIKHPRSRNRIKGIFGSMISVKSGEVNTPKGDEKIESLNKVTDAFKESNV